MARKIVVEVIALSFVILFLYTGISKLMEYSVFREQIAGSPILAPIAWWFAWLLPLSEFVAALLLFFPRTRLKGLYGGLVLMILFTGYIVGILNFSKHLPCSCGGILELLSWKAHLLFNSALILLAWIGIWLEAQSRKLVRTSSSSLIYN